MKIDFIKPNINESDIERMNEAIRSGWLAPGKYCEELEERLKEYLGVKYVKLTSSCTAALHAALILAGVKEGDEVITTPLSWVATSNVILYLKAKPVFSDVDDTGCIDTRKIEITSKTKAIIAVDLYGQKADYKALKSFGVPVIEDAAHCLMPVDGDYACFSFHAAKNLTCGNGGAIASNNPIDERLFYHGVERIDGKRVMTDFGYKGEMTDFQAALLIGQLERIEETQRKRKEVFNRYYQKLVAPRSYEVAYRGRVWHRIDNPHAYHLFVTFCKNRDEVRKKLAKKGIETSIHYPAIHLEPYYQKLGFRKGSFPIAEKMAEEVISLPTYPQLTEEEQDYIINNLKTL